jgi:hypothetical protein
MVRESEDFLKYTAMSEQSSHPYVKILDQPSKTFSHLMMEEKDASDASSEMLPA